MGLIGFVAELVVLGCILGGLGSNAAVLGLCNIMHFRIGGGSIGPWRVSVDGLSCVGWETADSAQIDWIRKCWVLAC